MEHPSHHHSLILNENYIARKGDVCRACNQQIVSGKSSVYSCSRSSSSSSIHENSSDEDEGDGIVDFLFGRTTMIIVSCAKFLLHKACAELPAYIQNPINPKESLKLCFNYSHETLISLFSGSLPEYRCYVCCIPLPWKVIQFLLYFSSDTADIYVCLKCALFQFQRSFEDRKIEHPAHSQHPLALIQRPSSFKCDACKLDDNNKDSSYICTKCQFWMHTSCADAPTTFQFQFHRQHPLALSFSLPRLYHKFLQHCRLCNHPVNRLDDWIYYCCYCRFFAHFQCARSNQMWSILDSGQSEKDPNSDVVHLPAADESSMNQLGEQFVKEMSTLCNNNNNISSIKHWAHDEHPLQLMTISELNNPKDDDHKIICDGCVKPIRTDDDDHPFYGCVPCKYFLHTFCAELPTEIKHYPCRGMTMSTFQNKDKYRLVYCDGCGVRGNGIFFVYSYKRYVHIGCAALLPKMIKHEAHSHKLINHVLESVHNTCCHACGKTFWFICNYRCDRCDYYICGGCIMKSRTINHPWDPHPLHLIYDPSMVIGDHVHDFNCEFCSKDINTNFWFYHCSDCDLSFHLDTCFERSRYQDYSKSIKFGATDIIIEKLHPHSLTFVLNKKVRSCEKCGREQLGEPVLECTCGAIFCIGCADDATKE